MTETGRELRDEAVAQVNDNADPAWKYVARKFVRELPVGTLFTTDRIWWHLNRMRVTTPEPRALGAIMLALAREDLIAKTGEYVNTTRPKAHSRPIPVWRRV